MQEKNYPRYRSMNLAICHQSLDRFQDSEDLRRFYEGCGLTGLEVIRAWESDQGKILPGMIQGVHLFFHIFWLDWWKGNYQRLDEEFDSREQWLEYFGGTDHHSYLNSFRADLEYAEAVGAKYVVFHVSEVMLEECYSYRFRYTDEEVIDASLEVIRALLSEREYSFDFLVENLWWSGFTLNDPALTRRLLDGIPTEQKGILLDTGHFMNTDPSLKTPEDAVALLHAMLDAHEREGLLPWFKGMHLQMSLSGDYYRAYRQDPACSPEKISQYPFYERFRVVTEHVKKLDQHGPFLGKGVRELIERIPLEYITFEYNTRTRAEYEAFAKAQSRELGYL